MIKKITIGQYYPVDSIIHRLDPRVKLFGTILFLIGIFLCSRWQGMFLCILWLACMIRAAKIPFRHMVRGLKGAVIIILFTVLFNILFISGTSIVDLGPIHISFEGIRTGLFIGLRLMMLILGSSVMTYTTSPSELTAGLEKSLRFLNVIRIPVHEIAMMMTIAIRFIPIFIEETNRIVEAQTARGADFESGGIIRKIRAYVPILIPVFAAVVRRAEDLSLAMESRCYHGGQGRTHLHPLKYSRRDVVSYIVVLLFFVLLIFLKHTGNFFDIINT